MIYYSKSVAWQEYDNNIYIIDNKNEQIFILDNEIAKIIWNDIDGKDIMQIVDMLSKYYFIESNKIVGDIEMFIDSLEKNNLIEVT